MEVTGEVSAATPRAVEMAKRPDRKREARIVCAKATRQWVVGQGVEVPAYEETVTEPSTRPLGLRGCLSTRPPVKLDLESLGGGPSR